MWKRGCQIHRDSLEIFWKIYATKHKAHDYEIQLHDTRALSTFFADVWKIKNRICKETGLKRVEKRCFVVGWVHLFTFYFYGTLLAKALKICKVVFLSWHRKIFIKLSSSIQRTNTNLVKYYNIYTKMRYEQLNTIGNVNCKKNSTL